MAGGIIELIEHGTAAVEQGLEPPRRIVHLGRIRSPDHRNVLILGIALLPGIDEIGQQQPHLAHTVAGIIDGLFSAGNREFAQHPDIQHLLHSSHSFQQQIDP